MTLIQMCSKGHNNTSVYLGCRLDMLPDPQLGSRCHEGPAMLLALPSKSSTPGNCMQHAMHGDGWLQRAAAKELQEMQGNLAILRQ